MRPGCRHLEVRVAFGIATCNDPGCGSFVDWSHLGKLYAPVQELEKRTWEEIKQNAKAERT